METLRAISARTAASRLIVCLLPAACCLLLTGCRNGRQMEADLYQRELRLQEDEIYRLEDYVEEYQSIISSYRCEIAELKRELAAAPTKPTPAGAREPASSREPEPTPRADEDASLLITPNPTDFDPPSAEPLPAGQEAPPAGDEAPPFRPSDAESLEVAPPFEGARLDSGHATPIAAAPREPALLQPISATLPATRTRSDNPPNPYPNATSKRPLAIEPLPESIGDPSIRVVAEDVLTEGANAASPSIIVIVEPVEANALRRFRGSISVMLTDPADDRRSKRIARWDFDESEVGALLSDGPDLRMTIALPTETPTDRPLRLWVRMVDRSGSRKLQATNVRFLANPLRMVDGDSLAKADNLHRLPAPAGSKNRTEVVVHSPTGGWRASNPDTTDRRLDPAVAPAAYEAW